MKIEESNISDLQDRNDRAIAKLARIARNDTVFGGARALVLADRLEAMGSQIDAHEIVGNVYAASNWTVTDDYKVCMCPECGQTVLGVEAALNCCAFVDEPEIEFENEEEVDENEK